MTTNTTARFGQCDETCTADCGHCKGAGRPTTCCGRPMYECGAPHTDGKRYWHCHGCATNREIVPAEEWTRRPTTAELVTKDEARVLAQRVLSAHRVHANFALERGKKVADMNRGPQGRHIYEVARRRDEAGRLEYQQQHDQLTRLVLDLIHTRDELTARLNQQH